MSRTRPAPQVRPLDTDVVGLLFKLLSVVYGLRRLVHHVRAQGALPRPAVLRVLWATWQGRWAEVVDARDRGPVRARQHAANHRLSPSEAEHIRAWLSPWPSRPTVAVAAQARWRAPPVYDRLSADAESADAVLLTDTDGELLPEAVAALVAAWRDRGCVPDAVLADEYHLGPDGEVCDGLFRPSWSPELAASAAVYRRPILLSVDAWRRLGQPALHAPVDSAADTELLRRLDTVVHIPRAVARVHADLSTGAAFRLASRPDTPAQETPRRVCEHKRATRSAGAPPLVSAAPVAPLVSILVPTRDQAPLLIRCVESLLAVTTYREFELLVLDNGSTQPTALAYLDRLRRRRQCRVLSLPSGPEGFNYSAINNRGAEAVDPRSEFLLLLNNDTELRQPDWLGQLVSAAQRPGVGAVGPKLLFPDGGIQQAGMVLDVGHSGVGGHVEYIYRDPRVRPPSGVDFSELPRNVAALGAACLLLPTRLYHGLGGLEERSLRVGYSDIDLCWRIRAAGYRLVYWPSSVVVHHESRSRGPVPDWRESAAFARRLRSQPTHRRGDPYHNANLARDAEPFELLCTRRRRAAWATSRPPTAVSVWVTGTPDAAFDELRAELAGRPELRLTDRPDQAAAILRYGLARTRTPAKPTVWLLPELVPDTVLAGLPPTIFRDAYRVLWPSAEARRRCLRFNSAGNFGVLPIGPNRSALLKLVERAAELRAETRRRLGWSDAEAVALPLDRQAERLLRGQPGWAAFRAAGDSTRPGGAELLAADVVVAVPPSPDRLTRRLLEAATLGRPLLVGTHLPGRSPGWCQHYLPSRAGLAAELARLREPTIAAQLSEQASAWAECRPCLADTAQILAELLTEAAELAY